MHFSGRISREKEWSFAGSSREEARSLLAHLRKSHGLLLATLRKRQSFAGSLRKRHGPLLTPPKEVTWSFTGP